MRFGKRADMTNDDADDEQFDEIDDSEEMGNGIRLISVLYVYACITEKRRPPGVIFGHDMGKRKMPSMSFGKRAMPSMSFGKRALPGMAFGKRALPGMAFGKRALPGAMCWSNWPFGKHTVSISCST
jgi:hypothetical protein